MTQRPDDLDRNWDRFLSRIGPHLGLPADPDAQRFSKWRRAARRAGAAGWLARHRVATLWTGSGALAAAVVLAVLLLMSPHQVDARTIFGGLRQAMDRCMRLTFDNVSMDLALLHPDMHGNVRLSGSVVASGLEQRKAFAELDLSLSSDAAAAGVPPLDMRVLTAAVSGSEWSYVRFGAGAPVTGGIGPFVALLTEVARQGVYVDMGGALQTDVGRRAVAWPALGLKILFKLRDRDGLDGLLELVEQNAGNVVVQRQPGDQHEYCLTARGLTLPRGDDDDRPRLRQVLAGLLRNMDLKVYYNDSRGVRRLDIEQFGPEGGRVTLLFEGAEFDDGLVDMARHQQQNPGLILNARALWRIWKKGLFAALQPPPGSMKEPVSQAATKPSAMDLSCSHLSRIRSASFA
jgi:hypothetical protein